MPQGIIPNLLAHYEQCSAIFIEYHSVVLKKSFRGHEELGVHKVQTSTKLGAEDESDQARGGGLQGHRGRGRGGSRLTNPVCIFLQNILSPCRWLDRFPSHSISWDVRATHSLSVIVSCYKVKAGFIADFNIPLKSNGFYTRPWCLCQKWPWISQ